MIRRLAWFLGLVVVFSVRLRAEVLALPGYQAVALQPGGLNRLALPTLLEGRPLTFLLDTGAALSAIDRAGVKAWKLQPPARELGLAKSKVLNGRKADVVWLPNLQAAGMPFGALPMTVLPDGTHFADYEKHKGKLSGLFGSDLLRRYEAVVNVGTGQVYFKTDPKAHLDLAKILLPIGYVGVPMEQRKGIYYVPCKLRKFAFEMLVDTGAFATILREKKLDLFAVPYQKTRMKQRAINGSGTTLSLVQPGDHRLSVGGLPLAFPVGATNDPMLERSSGFDELGILGCDLLGLHGAIIDYGTLTLYLRPPKAKR